MKVSCADAAAGGRVVEVIVQPDDAGNHGVPGEVDDLRARRSTAPRCVLPTAVMRPFSMTTVWSSRAAAPVPSISFTCVQHDHRRMR